MFPPDNACGWMEVLLLLEDLLVFSFRPSTPFVRNVFVIKDTVYVITDDVATCMENLILAYMWNTSGLFTLKPGVTHRN